MAQMNEFEMVGPHSYGNVDMNKPTFDKGQTNSRIIKVSSYLANIYVVGFQITREIHVEAEKNLSVSCFGNCRGKETSVNILDGDWLCEVEAKFIHDGLTAVRWKTFSGIISNWIGLNVATNAHFQLGLDKMELKGFFGHITNKKIVSLGVLVSLPIPAFESMHKRLSENLVNCTNDYIKQHKTDVLLENHSQAENHWKLSFGLDLSLQNKPINCPKISSLRVMTFNIRYAGPEDRNTPNRWEFRKKKVADVIKQHKADIFGLQEVLHSQYEDLQHFLPHFQFVGVGRDDGNRIGEACKIGFRRARFKLLSHETLWLSTEPDKVASVGWDAALPRIVTWGKLWDLHTNRCVILYNAHLDHFGGKARLESVKQILALVKKHKQLGCSLVNENENEVTDVSPIIIFVGDFNSEPNSDAYRLLMDSTLHDWRLHDSMLVALDSYGPIGTFTGFNFHVVPPKRIDFIFVDEKTPVLSHSVITDSWDGIVPSDHRPVIIELLAASN